jgi:hypothetical protein
MMPAQQKQLTIVLYMPEEFQGVGGIQMLIINLARELQSERHSHVSLIVYCSKTSFVAERVASLIGSRCVVRYWEDGMKPIPPNSLLLVWGGCRTPMRFRKFNPRVLLWCVSPGQAFVHFNRAARVLPFLRRHFDSRRWKVISYLVASQGIVVMDKRNLSAVRSLAGSKLNIPFLPIGIPVTENAWVARQSSRGKEQALNIAYIGRGSAEWKVIPFVSFLADSILPQQGVNVTIYTDRTDMYEKFLHLRGLNSKPISVTYRLNLSGADIREELANSCDISCGMGLSVLEGGSVGVPSVYIAPSHDAGARPYWEWLCDRFVADFDLEHDAKPESQQLDLGEFTKANGRLTELSDRSFNYVRQYHSIENVADMLCAHSWDADLAGYLDAHGGIIRSMARMQRTKRNSPY